MKQSTRETLAEWQRLRRDKLSALVTLAVIVAGLASLLAVLGILLHPTRAADRSSPIYWVLMLPFAWWAASLASYTPWAVRTLRPAAIAFIVASLIALVLATRQNTSLTPWIVAAAVAIACAATGMALFPSSLLWNRSARL